MWGKCTKYCRLLVLSLIVVVTAVILHFNKKNINIEKFTNFSDKKTNFTKTINNVYKNTLSRNANEFEIEKLIQLMTSDTDERTVFEIIKSTEEYRDKNNLDMAIKKSSGVKDHTKIEEALNAMQLKERVEIYRSIIDTYEKILERVPLLKEMNYYAYRITNDTSFNVQQLETILILSNEHRIIEKNQTNVVNFELRGNVTEAQLKFEVGEIYKKALNVDTEPPYELEQFLKKRYIDYQMDKAKLTKLIILLDMMDRNEITKETFDTSYADVMNSTSINSNNINGTGKNGLNSTNNTLNGKGVVISGQSIVNNSGNPTKPSNLTAENEAVKKEIINSLKQVTAKYPDADFRETIECINNGGFNIDKNVKNNGKNNFAEYQSQRNINQINDMQNTNSKYLNANEDMILFPEFKWDVPQKRPPVCYYNDQNPVQPSIDQTALIGTLLEQSKNTSVGSIMPPFTYTEN